jgi:hypothetical protein
MTELTDLMKRYKNIKEKLIMVENQFEKFKQVFQTDFEPDIAKLEGKRIEQAEMDAIRIVQQEQQRKVVEQSMPVPTASNINVSLREIPQEEVKEAQGTDDGSAPAKMTRRKKSEEYEPSPETAVAAKKPGQLFKIYRKLCKRFHPDVHGDDQQFLKIQENYESGDNVGLFDTAIENDISIDDYIDNREEMANYWQQEITRMEQEIYNLTHMLPWVWCMADEIRKQALRPTMIVQIQQHGI